MTPNHPPDAPPATPHGLAKTPTGILGLDEVLGGGAPTGRATLVCGGPGSGKTLLGVEFLVRGILDHDEPGVLIPFEETAKDLADNSASLGFDLQGLVDDGRLVVDHVEMMGEDLAQSGGFDLEALFLRIDQAVKKVGARRIVLDTLENLFDGLPDPRRVRAEVHRLFAWLKERGLTAIVTAEAGERTLTRQGMEEYVSDCVLSLEQNVVNQVTTRRVRVVKYRGSAHGTNQYPFIIDEDGFIVAPITESRLDRKASTERLSTGVDGLDAMLGGDGHYRGSTILVSGTAGTGKTTLAAHFAEASVRRKEPCLFYSFEQAADTILRDTGRLGDKLRKGVDADLLHFEGGRPSAMGLDKHLAIIRRRILEISPQMVILDPITGFGPIGAQWEVKNMLILLMDTIAKTGATLVLTSLSKGDQDAEMTTIGVSSLADTWIILSNLGESDLHTRGIYVLKSRGTAHSHKVHSLSISADGVTVGEQRPSRQEADA